MQRRINGFFTFRTCSMSAAKNPILQSTRVTTPMTEILQTLGIPLPKKILEVSE
jgi:hypothetical protein